MTQAKKIQCLLKTVAILALAGSNLWLTLSVTQMAIYGSPGRWIFERLQFLLADIHLLPFLPPFQLIQAIPFLRDASRLTQVIQYSNLAFASLAAMGITTLSTTLITWVFVLNIPEAIAHWVATYQANLAHRRAIDLLASLEALDFTLIHDSEVSLQLIPIRSALRTHVGHPDEGVLITASINSHEATTKPD